MIKSILWPAVMGILIMVIMIGGTICLVGTDYWPGWVFGITFSIFYAVTIYMFHDKPAFVKQRFNFHGLIWWDKILLAVYGVTFIAVFIVIIADVQNKWTGEIPLAAYILNYLLFLFSLGLTNWAKWTNAFFATVVKIQKGHRVVQSGPYRYVRHPGYLAGLLMFMTIGPVLGSLWALVPGAIACTGVIIRTYLEDKTLQKELPGYMAYAKKVRYRLLPGVW